MILSAHLQEQLGHGNASTNQERTTNGSGTARSGTRNGGGRDGGGSRGGRAPRAGERSAGGRVGGSRGRAGDGGDGGVGRRRLGLGGLGGGRLAGIGLGLGSRSLGGARGRGRGGSRSGSGSRARGGGRRVLAAVTLDDFDALPAARLVTVDVLLDATVGGAVLAGVVDNGDALVIGVEGSLGEVGEAASPLTSALRRVLATSAPGSELDLHGSLGELVADSGGIEHSDALAVDHPVDLLGSPLDGVRVEGTSGITNGVVLAAVVGGSVSLAEVVGLDLGVVGADKFPINLVSESLMLALFTQQSTNFQPGNENLPHRDHQTARQPR